MLWVDILDVIESKFDTQERDDVDLSEASHCHQKVSSYQSSYSTLRSPVLIEPICAFRHHTSPSSTRLFLCSACKSETPQKSSYLRTSCQIRSMGPKAKTPPFSSFLETPHGQVNIRAFG